MPRAAAFALCLAAAIAVGAAAPRPPPRPAGRTILGAGALTCARWAADRRSEAYVPAAQWMLGYLSRGDRDRSRNGLARVKAPQVIGWVDRYCAAHAGEPLETAAAALERELAAGKALPPPAKAKARPKGKPEDVPVEDVS